MACNRDERRSRLAAVPPVRHRVGNVRTVWPVDPISGGTWIGANDRGLTMVILNRAGPACRPPSGARSRGTIIPQLLRHRSLDAAVARAAELPFPDFDPFTLVMLQDRAVFSLTYDGAGASVRDDVLSRPLMFTSSSLGDPIVTPPRQQLFRELVESSPAPLTGQAAFHRHSWPDLPQISVRMSRPEAATVSQTEIDVAGGFVRMRYRPLGHSHPAGSKDPAY